MRLNQDCKRFFHGWSGRAEHFAAADCRLKAGREKQLEEMSSVRELQGKMQRAVLFMFKSKAAEGVLFSGKFSLRFGARGNRRSSNGFTEEKASNVLNFLSAAV